MATVNIEMEEWEEYQRLKPLSEIIDFLEKREKISISRNNSKWSATFVTRYSKVQKTIESESWQNFIQFLEDVRYQYEC